MGNISSSTLLKELSIRIPQRITRNTGNSLLYINNLNDPLNVMCKYYNEFSQERELTADSVYTHLLAPLILFIIVTYR